MNRQLRFGLPFLLLTASLYTKAQTIRPQQIDSLLHTIVQPNEPGVSLAIWQKNKLVYARGYGLADLSARRKITPATPFNIASMSKQFTAASIYLLESRGKLSSSDKLSKFFPDFPAYADSITLAHLIHHQSGLRDHSALIWLRDMNENGNYNDSVVYNILSRQRSLNFTPGSRWSYSNSGYFLLGRIVQQVSGQDLDAFVAANIFKPLRMKHTQLSRTHKVPGKANGYIQTDKGFKENNPTTGVIGQGNGYSVVTDFGPWFKEMKEHRLLGDAAWKKMLTPSVTDSGEDTKYGGGLHIQQYKGQLLVSHGGDISGYHSRMYHFPASGLDILMFSNNDRITGSPEFRAIYSLLYPEPKAAATVNQASIAIDTASLTGIYVAAEDSALNISVNITEDKIMARQHWNDESYALVPENDSTLAVEGAPAVKLVFAHLAEGKAKEMYILQDGQRIAFKRTDRVAGLDAQAAIQYAGDYYNSEIDARYRVIFSNGQLVVHIGQASYNMTRVGLQQGVFGLDNGLVLEFHVDEAGKATGFTLVHARVSDLRFVRE
ncbi:beta-lactamase family protein [Chitinophaga horti]|uniref:Beta-lactamase family protein n=1 Tax=Chitinophaga horti TaxID=2920382 RepID=A0ABY6J7R6_9BACT|nr:serine hydrolase domain-containing protein [Chitinophaga horti]UYQ95721.1 beta-lactamase family protein [Chitinophaga horti]